LWSRRKCGKPENRKCREKNCLFRYRIFQTKLCI